MNPAAALGRSTRKFLPLSLLMFYAKGMKVLLLPLAGFSATLFLLAFVFSKTLGFCFPFDPFHHGHTHHKNKPVAASPDVEPLEHIFDALRIMQTKYFENWVGTWPTAIDWTAAVMQTVLTGAVASISRAINSPELAQDSNWKLRENLVDMYFDQIIGSYFGQDAFAIREQAFDDMLWVVLGWLEAIQFINERDELYSAKSKLYSASGRIDEILWNTSWHGTTWAPSFAHRTHVFWKLASRGWDTKLCGGGMNWNPRLLPYKNAITNELWISASIKMYLYFPGDDNNSPFHSQVTGGATACSLDALSSMTSPCPPQDSQFLEAAVQGYKWLMSSGMINKQGLFADGFHIRNIEHGGTECNALNEMVFTYNQGVILSGCRRLFQITGARSYLKDGHHLIRSVLRATGWDIKLSKPVDSIILPYPFLPEWHGLGRAGVLEEWCDSRGTCSQNSQTFKGIFFHHLIEFCSPFSELEMNAFRKMNGIPNLVEIHRLDCKSYLPWINYNARAALLSRDTEGRFGTWWTAGLLDWEVPLSLDEDEDTYKNWTDYRTNGLPDDGIWYKGDLPPWTPDLGNRGIRRRFWVDTTEEYKNDVIEKRHGTQHVLQQSSIYDKNCDDPNERGRGRTVETQAGGVSVLRAQWEFSKL